MVNVYIDDKIEEYEKDRNYEGLWVNRRGINVSSNVGKVFERIINNRIIKMLPFTEAQAGGRKEYSTVDQLFILKSIIRKSVFQKKRPLYITFLDIENVILYILWQKGIRGKYGD